MNTATYELPSLPYAIGDLEPLYSRELLELHHDKHHAAYVAGANKALADLAQAREKREFHSIGQLEKNLAFNVSGHLLHCLLWRNLGPDRGGAPQQRLARSIARDFGDMDAFREHLTAAAMTIQGSGWAALCWEPVGRQLVVQQIFDHQGNMSGSSIPVLVLDMWEHAYYLQYRNDKKKWVSAFWELVNWTDVDKRLAKAQAADLELMK